MEPNCDIQCFETANAGVIFVVRLRAQFLDSHVAIVELSRELSRLVKEGESRNVLLDLAVVEALSSVMLGKLIEFKKLVWFSARFPMSRLRSPIRGGMSEI